MLTQLETRLLSQDQMAIYKQATFKINRRYQ